MASLPFHEECCPRPYRAARTGTVPQAQRRTDVAVLMGRFGTGGVERVGCLLQDGFADRGLATDVLVANRSGPLADFVGAKSRVIELTDLPRSAGRGLSLLLSIPRLVRYLSRHRPRILLSPGNHTNMAAALAHRLSGGGSRLVLKITNPILNPRHDPIRRAVRRWLYGWAFTRAAQVLVLSRHAEREIGGIWPAAASKLRFVHNPYVETSAKVPVAPAAESGSTRLILSVGRLTPQKNHALLLRSLARLKRLPWRLVLLGEGPLEAKLRTLAATLGIADRVEFAGFVSDPSSRYREAHVLALSSDWEDLPAVVLEALAAGVPVVATACSGSLIDVMRKAGHGTLTKPGDTAAFAEALEGILTSAPQRKPFSGAQDYSIESGINDHFAALQFLLAGDRLSPVGTGQPARQADSAIA